jgi:type IV pilus assembly protein PilP
MMRTALWMLGATTLLAWTTVSAEPPAAPPGPGAGAGAAAIRGDTGRAPAANDAVYDPVGKRDPFRPPRANQTNLAGEARTPLQRYDIGQLRLVAVIYEAAAPRAVVEDDAGLGYIVRVGTPIGANGGAVKAIERGKVRVEEESIDFYGDRQTSEVVMELATDERGKR